MKKVAITIVVLMCSRAFGLTPMGPTIPDVEQGKFGIDFGYGNGEIDVKASGYGISATLSDIDFSTTFAQFNYGIAENWQASFRLGMAEIENGDDFFWGLGTKVALGEYYGLNWGALFQINWFKVDDTFTIGGYSGKSEIDAYEIQIALGTTYELNDTVSIYGGPFLHFIDGDWDVKSGGLTYSFDIEQESEIGGYVGISTEIAENADLNLEYQFTGDAQTVGLKIVWKF